MDFVGNLLGSDGCNVDGSVSRNPITGLADQLFDSLAFNNNHMDQANYAPATINHGDLIHDREYSSMTSQFQNVNLQTLPSMSMHNMDTMNSPMNQLSDYAVYAQQMHMSQMMQHSYMMNQGYDQQIHGIFHQAEENAFDQQEHAFKVYDEILAGNGTDYESLMAMSTEDQNLMLGGLYASNSKVTSAGNESAWQNIAYHLETKMREYIFRPDNPHEKQDVDSLFQKGMELFKEGEVNEAVLVFEAVVKQDADAVESWRMLGLCHCELDNDKVAIECFKRAVDIDPYNIEALRDLGTSYVNELNSIRALETLRAWITHNPRYVGLDIKVDAHSDGSLMDEVLHLMIEAEAYAPDDPDVLSVLGVLCNVSMDYECAINCFERALAIQPESYSLLNKLGATLANANKSSRAIPMYAQALELRPKYARCWLNLGISYSNMNQNKESAMAYLQALRLSPDAKHIWSYLRMVLTTLNRLDLVEMSSKEDINTMTELISAL